MKTNKFYKVVAPSALMIIIFLLTLTKTPEQVSNKLYLLTSEMSHLAVAMHTIYWIFIALGLAIKSARTFFFSALLLILSATATFISVKYVVVPNILIFASFFVLTLIATCKRRLAFDFSSLKPINKIIGFLALIFASWYLHWVEPPVLLNAFLYSPLGLVNCPTILAFCGFLCLQTDPQSKFFELFVAIITIYFGFYGIMRLGAYIDVLLIISGLFLVSKHRLA